MNKLDLSLYLVADLRPDTMRNEWLQQVIAAVAGGVTVVQLRAKDVSGRVFYETALALRQRLDFLSVPLIINDRLDIAMAIDAAGLHVGQDDLPPQVVRHLWGEQKLVGVSAHSVAEAQTAVAAGADYLGAGAMFATTTKTDTTCLALHELTAMTAAVSVPIVAIGGIKADNTALVMTSGCAGVAVSSAIMAAEDAKQAATAIKQQFAAGK